MNMKPNEAWIEFFKTCIYITVLSGSWILIHILFQRETEVRRELEKLFFNFCGLQWIKEFNTFYFS